MKRVLVLAIVLCSLAVQIVHADDARFQLVVSRNDASVGGEFHAGGNGG